MLELIKKSSDKDYPVPEHEAERQEKLEEYKILDTLPDDEFDSLVELAAIMTDSPVSLMNLLDKDRQWTKAAYGIQPVDTVLRSNTVCQYTILQDGNYEVEDFRQNNRFKDKDFVVDDPHYRYYSGFPLITPDGYKLGALCVLDYTPKSLNEQQKKALKTISDEIVSRLELRKKQFELEELNKEKDQFLRAVNHDIKSPINGIISTTHYLQNVWDGDQEELDKLLHMIELSGRKLVNYTSELMSNAMFQHQTVLHLDDVEITALINDLIDIYAPLAKAKRVELELKCQTQGTFTLDVEKFKLILSNLISNALKFSAKDDLITVDAEFIQGSPRILHLSVSDTGIGIPDEFLPDLFEKNKKHQRQGTQGEISTGMGLPIVKKFVDLHDGGVKVTTEEGQGTTFHIVIPEQEKKN